MNKSIVLVLFCVFKAVCAVHPDPENQTPETYAQESAGVDLPPDKSLADTRRNDVLPLIAIVQPPAKILPFQYQMPEELLNYELTEDGKLINEIRFGPLKEGNQIFFCPWAENDEQEKCLVRQTFEKSVTPKCAMEQTPEWVNMEIDCGENDEGTIFQLVYKVCVRDEYPLDPPFIPFYLICFDSNSWQVLYTSHEIRSPRLLNLNLLAKERSMDYSMFDSIGDIESPKWAATSTETTETTEPSYKLQQLVPPEDMPFATWRKTTFSDLNYERLHMHLIEPWNRISRNIRSVAKKYVASGGKFLVNTAVKRVHDSPESSEHLSNTWVKMIYILKRTDDEGWKATHGTAILMNNFIKSEENTARLTPPSLEEYCDENLCIDELTQEINRIGSEIRCCKITSQISTIFGIKNMEETIQQIPIPNITVPENDEILLRPVLLEKTPIPNLTVVEDHETLRDPISLEKAAASLQEIEPSETLPLILSAHSQHPNKSEFFLQHPKSIVKIETKNRRIVQGSEFTDAPWKVKNILFCPKEDSDETCLVPVNFGRYEQLRCVKEAIPVVEEPNENLKCGFEYQGVHKEVVYKICPAEQPDTTFDFSGGALYEICYDIGKKKNLYTRHSVSFPRLILSNLLLRERGMNHFDMMEDEFVSVSDLPLRKSAMNHSDMMEVDSVPVSDPGDENPLPDYELQKLVPPEDMAFGLWKKSTYKHINADWQHKKLKPYWDRINNRIRNHILWHTDHRPVEQNPFLDFITHDPDDVTYYSPSDDNPKYIIHTGEQSSTSTTAEKKNKVPEYCEDIPCLNDIKKEIEAIGGQVACCLLHGHIPELFDMDKYMNLSKTDVMPIRGINV